MHFWSFCFPPFRFLSSPPPAPCVPTLGRSKGAGQSFIRLLQLNPSGAVRNLRDVNNGLSCPCNTELKLGSRSCSKLSSSTGRNLSSYSDKLCLLLGWCWCIASSRVLGIGALLSLWPLLKQKNKIKLASLLLGPIQHRSFHHILPGDAQYLFLVIHKHFKGKEK